MKPLRSTVAFVMVYAVTFSVLLHGQDVLTGSWEGRTGQGREVRLDVRVDNQKLTGTFSVDRKDADISNGKIAGKTFSFTVVMGNQTVAFTGELIGDDIELIHEGARDSVRLSRVTAKR